MAKTPSADLIGALTDPEQRLVAAAATGTILHLTKDETVRAVVVRALACTERADWHVAPEGVRLNGGRIAGRLDCAERVISCPVWLIAADIPDGLDLTNAQARTLSLNDSRVGGFGAQGIRIEGDVLFRNATVSGVCAVNGATITGQFSANGASFDNPDGDAINAQGSSIGGLFLRNATLKGVCDINNATIKGQFSANGASFDNPKGFAIEAHSSRIGSLVLRLEPDVSRAAKPVTITGTLSLIFATIEGDADLKGIEWTGGPDASLAARHVHVKGNVYLNNGARIEGALRCFGARIDGRLDLSGSSIKSRAAVSDTAFQGRIADDPFPFTALDLSEAQVGQLLMPDPVDDKWPSCTRPRGIVDLSRARIGTLTDFAAGWPDPVILRDRYCPDRLRDADERDADHLVLDGFEYQHLDNPDGNAPGGELAHAARLRWLRAQSCDDLFTRLRPQPWRHLAKTLAAQGYEEEARRIAIERRVAQRYASGTSRFARAVSWLLHLLADYGFNPWKAVSWSGGVIVTCALVYWWAAVAYCTPSARLCAEGIAFVRTVPADFVPGVDNPMVVDELAKRYPVFDPLSYSFDVFLPLFDVGTERFWRVNTTTGWGLVLYYFTVAEQIAGAILVSLIVTGFTGLLTRNEA